MRLSFKHPVLNIAGILASYICLQSPIFANDYSQPISGLPVEQKLNFKIGESVFQKFWVPSPSSTTASDGLGPLFNTRSCNNCHILNGRGHAPEPNIYGSSIPSFLVRFGQKVPNQELNPQTIYPNLGDEVYGKQLQGHNSQGVTSEGDFQLTYTVKKEKLADGTIVELRKPSISWSSLNYGPLGENTEIALLVSPPLVGMGLLDNIPDDVILKNADPEDSNKDGISGRVNWVVTNKHGTKSIGRFGYKATATSVNVQNQQAFNIDLGLSTPLERSPSGDCTEHQVACISSLNGNSTHLGNVEADKEQVKLVNLFVSLSSPPKMRNLRDTDFLEGKKYFDQANCAACHIPKMTTGSNATYPILNNRIFYPFTDMLLHDMGDDLASGFPIFSAHPNEWRTAPLWGIGLSEKVSGRKGFLHDGRARTIEEAILWHGGEAKQSQQFYKQLESTQRSKLIYFLESL
ncbi:c-type cytochrome [Marinomonas sp. C2222]|uniref:C-type cytochrome n=1 Tax=Marinomonas sargassi TaxID=2984494 RepID=A0ABT2YRV2_9GAMM|nr:di-heme oxidoredictase family protein [Marinomonas sargassi]MCV2402623.1 c-type cytochrome [Marinomonas sargassi]